MITSYLCPEKTQNGAIVTFFALSSSEIALQVAIKCPVGSEAVAQPPCQGGAAAFPRHSVYPHHFAYGHPQLGKYCFRSVGRFVCLMVLFPLCLHSFQIVLPGRNCTSVTNTTYLGGQRLYNLPVSISPDYEIFFVHLTTHSWKQETVFVPFSVLTLISLCVCISHSLH